MLVAASGRPRLAKPHGTPRPAPSSASRRSPGPLARVAYRFSAATASTLPNSPVEAPPWPEGVAASAWWASRDNQRLALAYLERSLGIHSPEQWYTVSQNWQAAYPGADALLRHTGGSTAKLLSVFYPNHPWKAWKFTAQGLPKEFFRHLPNRRLFLDDIRSSNLESSPTHDADDMAAFYDLTGALLTKNGGVALIQQYDGSVYELLRDTYPEHQWELWKFKRAPKEQWTNPDNLKPLLVSAGQKLGINRLEDWYSVQFRQLRAALDDTRPLRFYKDSGPLLIMAAFPEHKWRGWEFAVAPRHFWSHLPNQRAYLQWLGTKLGYSSMEDWYNITYEAISKNKGSALLQIYDHSACLAVREVLKSDYEFHLWKFRVLPRRTLGDKQFQATYVAWLEKQLGFDDESNPRRLEKWYELSSAVIRDNYGAGLLDFFGGSMPQFLAAAHPEHRFLPWKFKLPANWWKRSENLREFFDRMKEELGLESMNDWYAVDIETHLNRYKIEGGVIRALMRAYPNHQFRQWRFRKTPSGFWRSVRSKAESSTIRSYLEDLAKVLSLDPTKPEEWYRVSTKNLGSGAIKVLGEFGGLISTLKLAYPEHSWNKTDQAGARAKLAQQLALKRFLDESEVVWEEHAVEVEKNSGQGYTRTGQTSVVLDLFLPNHLVGFEYQGEQHFWDVRFYGEIAKWQESDPEKAWILARQGIRIVEVPYWVDLATLEPQALGPFASRPKPSDSN